MTHLAEVFSPRESSLGVLIRAAWLVSNPLIDWSLFPCLST